MSMRSRAGCLALGLCFCGCQSASPERSSRLTAQSAPQAAAPVDSPALATKAETADASAVTVVASFQQPPASAADDPFVATGELSLDALVTAALDRNPTLEGLTAAWQAATQRSAGGRPRRSDDASGLRAGVDRLLERRPRLRGANLAKVALARQARVSRLGRPVGSRRRLSGTPGFALRRSRR